ncbi:MAG: prenyltransferase/squalene oxidase repeat-containing protein, partial [Clostridia bacterium]
YLSRLESYVAEKYFNQGGLDSSKITEWHRIAITVSALGGDPANFGGVNLIKDGITEPVIPLDRQGINGLIWAVIAADRCGAEVPEETISAVCDSIVVRQNPDGGFSMRGDSDPDITSMAIRALAGKKGYSSYAALAGAALKGMQNSDGGFESMGEENCESISQAILALCALGENPESAAERLMAYRNPDGGFAHVIGGESNSMASVQAMEALIEYEKVIKSRQSKPVVSAAEPKAEIKEEVKNDEPTAEAEEITEPAEETPEEEEAEAPSETEEVPVENEETEAPAEETEPAASAHSVVFYIVVAVIVIAIIGGGAAYVIYRKKKK